MKILAVSSEMVPYAKTGGLADVLGALPAALTWAAGTIFGSFCRFMTGSVAKNSTFPR
jgi:glycogen synthase